MLVGCSDLAPRVDESLGEEGSHAAAMQRPPRMGWNVRAPDEAASSTPTVGRTPVALAQGSRRDPEATPLGLDRHVRVVVDRGALAEEQLSHGMRYFPSTGFDARLDTAMALNRLYEEAIPGFGVYTFVLVGQGFTNRSDEEAWRHRELFRVIETYVSSAHGERPPEGTRPHAFLVPVDPESVSRALSEQIASELSDVMRAELGHHLRRGGQGQLARRLEQGAGPFLVASLEPRLLPTSAAAPRLVADLSQIGPEYFLAIVDAYDRPIPAEARGRSEGLASIRERLLALLTTRMSQRGAQSVSEKAWIFMLGRFAVQLAGPPRFHLVRRRARQAGDPNA